jgi:hypothetical protein
VTLTNEQVNALEGLDAVFGDQKDINPLHVDVLHTAHYESAVSNYINFALSYYKHYLMAIDPNLPEIQNELREAKRKAEFEKNAVRASDKRESLVTGILAGIAPKARRAGDVSFEIDDNVVQLLIQGPEKEILELTYDRHDFFLRGHLKGEDFEDEDWSALNGNARPVDQSGALAAVTDYLDALVPGE